MAVAVLSVGWEWNYAADRKSNDFNKKHVTCSNGDEKVVTKSYPNGSAIAMWNSKFMTPGDAANAVCGELYGQKNQASDSNASSKSSGSKQDAGECSAPEFIMTCCGCLPDTEKHRSLIREDCSELVVCPR
jgi:hypothetical protein